MSSSIGDTWEVMESNEFSCPEGTEEKRERWSKRGYSRSCSPPLNGKWEAWDEGFKHIDGYYDHGVKDGKWVWYQKDGTVYRIIKYNKGIETSNTVFENN